MNTFCKIFLVMAIGLSGLPCQAQAPEGKLIYCSYARTGAAGLGKDYCELIADPGTAPSVKVVLRDGNRFGDPVIRKEFPATPEDVRTLQEWLADNKVYELAGYRLDEEMTGGYSYRIYMEYDSGERIDARWYGHGVKKEAAAAYGHIQSFFNPWRSQALRAYDPIVQCSYSIRRTATMATDRGLLLCEPDYTPKVVIDLDVNNRFGDPETHEQFNISPQKAKQLQQELEKLGVGEMESGSEEALIEGGSFYEVSVKFASGRELERSWRTSDSEGRAVYDVLVAFFEECLSEKKAAKK